MESDKRIPCEIRYPQAGALEFRQELTARDRRFLKRTLAFAARREVSYSNHCAIAVRAGKVLGIAFNSYKNNPRCLSDEHLRAVAGRNSSHGVGPHAEISVLNQLTDADGVIIYVGRVLKDGTVGNSRPCEVCTEEMLEAGVKRVVWTEEGAVL